MNAFLAVLCLAVVAHASHVHHIPSGHVSVNKHGALIAGPAGSIHTDNGIHGHGAGARLSGPAGDVRTHGGHVTLHGPGVGHGHGGDGGDGGNNGGNGGGNGGGDGGLGQVWHSHHGIGHGIGHHTIGHGLIGHGGW